MLFSVLPPAEQEMIAVDYNPNLTTDDSRIKYIHGDVLEVLPTLEENSIGIVTMYAADTSIRKGDWPILWKQMNRILKPNGYVLAQPEVNIQDMPGNFAIGYFINDTFLIAFKEPVAS